MTKQSVTFLGIVQPLLSTIVVLALTLGSQAQQTVSTNTTAAVPPLVNFSGVLNDANGKPITHIVGVTFLLFKDQQGGAPLWMETQNVTPDKTGRYTVMLGSTTSAGLPSEIFVAGEAHWLGVQAQGLEEQPRVLLVSAPYALKAGDAQTLGGLPPSAFVMAAAPTTGLSSNSVAPSLAAPAGGAVTGTGKVNFIPLWDTTSDIISSIMFQSGSGSTAKVGIDTVTPTSTLDVKGSGTIRGLFSLPPTGTATATAGTNSQPQDLTAAAFSSSTNSSVSQTFQLQAEPVGNNTASPSGSLNLLFGSGATKPAETGLKIASNGQITFATGQTFPGTGTGTITGVTAGTDLTGGGTSGGVTLNLDTTKVPVLSASNTFVGNQSITGNLTDTGSITATGSVTGQTSGGTAISGTDNSTTGTGTGLIGFSSSNTGTGVWGQNNSAGGNFGGYGVVGLSKAIFGVGAGFFGGPPGTLSGTNYSAGWGILTAGGADTTSGGFGAGPGGTMYGGASSNGWGGDGGDLVGGSSSSTTGVAGNGVFGSAGAGQNPSRNGLPVAGAEGVGPSNPTTGKANGPGVFGGDFTRTLTGQGTTALGYGYGVWGDAGKTGSAGVLTTNDDGGSLIALNNSSLSETVSAYNASTSDVATVLLASTAGLNGFATLGGAGCGSNYFGLQLGGSFMSNCNNYTLLGDGLNTYINAGDGVSTGTIYFRINNVMPSAMKVNTDGSVTIPTLDVTTKLTKPAGSFKIDHPLDPANKFLYHSFVESPDMMNIYNGVATLDANGAAVVVLPDYFQALNRDFRYQLTAVGAPGPNLYIAKEIQNNQFTIAGGVPDAKVSWQVTGIRQDAFANAYRIQVEVPKTAEERGHYLHPELFGAPETQQIGYVAPFSARTPNHSNPLQRLAAHHASAVPATRIIAPQLPIGPKLPANVPLKPSGKTVSQTPK